LKSDELATWFESGEAVKAFPELKALMNGKKILGMFERHGLIELHLKDCVVTVDIRHFSLVEKVK